MSWTLSKGSSAPSATLTGLQAAGFLHSQISYRPISRWSKTGLLELKAKKFDWRRPAEDLEVILKSANERTLLLIDELPLLIASIVHQDPSGNRAERFLLWLKRLREQYSPRWFFAGSIGLDSVARRLKLSGTIHDLQPIELGEFSPEKARSYLMGRGQLYQWALTAETIDAILLAVEWPIPFHLNLVFDELCVVVSEGHGAPSPALVEIALQRLIAHGRTHFDHWDERLAKMLDARIQQYCEIILEPSLPRSQRNHRRKHRAPFEPGLDR